MGSSEAALGSTGMGSAAVAILGGGGKASGGRVVDEKAEDLGDKNGLLVKNLHVKSL